MKKFIEIIGEMIVTEFAYKIVTDNVLDASTKILNTTIVTVQTVDPLMGTIINAIIVLLPIIATIASSK